MCLSRSDQAADIVHENTSNGPYLDEVNGGMAQYLLGRRACLVARAIVLHEEESE